MIIFASPIFENTGEAVIGTLLLVTVIPAFALKALQGGSILLGIFQIIVLCLTEAAQWRFAVNPPPVIKLARAIGTYFASNLIFSVVVFAVVFLKVWAK